VALFFFLHFGWPAGRQAGRQVVVVWVEEEEMIEEGVVSIDGRGHHVRTVPERLRGRGTHRVGPFFP